MSAQTDHKLHQFDLAAEQSGDEPRCKKCGATFLDAMLDPVCSGTTKVPVTDSEEPEESAMQIEPILYQEHFLRISPTNECQACGHDHPTLIVSKCHPTAPMFMAWDAERGCLVVSCAVCGSNVGHICVSEAAYERWKATEEDNDEDEESDIDILGLNE